MGEGQEDEVPSRLNPEAAEFKPGAGTFGGSRPSESPTSSGEQGPSLVFGGGGNFLSKYSSIEQGVATKTELRRRGSEGSGSAPAPAPDRVNVQLNQQIVNAGMPERILQVVDENFDQLNAVNLITALHRLAAISLASKKAGLRRDPRFKRLVNRLSETIRKADPYSMKPQDLSNIAWGLTKLGIQNSMLFSLLSDRILVRIDSFQPVNLSMTLWAFARSGLSDERLLRAAAQEVKHQLKDFEPQQIANTTWAMAKCGYVDEVLFEQAAEHAISQLKKFQPMNFSMLLYSYALAQQRHEKLFQEVAKKCTVDVLKNSLSAPHVVSNLALAYSEAQIHIDSVYQAVAEVAIDVFEEFRCISKNVASSVDEFQKQELQAGRTPTFWELHSHIGELHRRLGECYQTDLATGSRDAEVEDVLGREEDRPFESLLHSPGLGPATSPAPLAPSRIFTDSSVSGIQPVPETSSSARMMAPLTPGPLLHSLIPSSPQTPAAPILGRSVTTGHTPLGGPSRVPSHQQGLGLAAMSRRSYRVRSATAAVPKPPTAELQRLGTPIAASFGNFEETRPERIETGTRIGRPRRQSLQESIIFQTKFDDDRKVAQQNFAKMERVVSKKIGMTVATVSERSKSSDNMSDKFGSEDECDFQIRQCFVATSDRPKRLSMQIRPGPSQTQMRLDEMSERERSRHCCSLSSRRFTITPGSKVRAIFDAIRMICVILDITVVPLQLFDLPRDTTLQAISLLTMTFWSLDILASFRTAYFEKGSLVIDPAKIAWNYLKRWLLFDLTVVTLDFVLEASGAHDSVMLTFLRMIRVGRLLKWNQMFASIRENIDSQIWITRLSIMNILIQILLMYHVVACSYWGLGRINADSSNWIDVYSLSDRSFGYQYTTTLHWAVCQLGLGANIIEATNFAERVFCIVTVLVALVTFSSLVSLMTSLLTSLHNVQEEEQHQFRLLRSFLLRNHIPQSLSQRVTKFLQHSYNIQREAISDSQVPLLAHLSKNLFGELQFARYQRSLSSMAFVETLLEGRNHQHMQILHDMSVQALAQSVLAKGEVVFYAGNLAEQCFVASTGQLEYCQGKECTTVCVDQWVAEMCLYTPWSYLGDLFTQELSIMVIMNMEGFCECVCKSPDMQLQTRKFAQLYVDLMKNDQTSSDLWTMPGSEDESSPSTRVLSTSPKNTRKTTPSSLLEKLFGVAGGGGGKRRASVRRASLLPNAEELRQLQELQNAGNAGRGSANPQQTPGVFWQDYTHTLED
ncbi:KCNH7 [Symbiodinium natans]|uniref:KCNH7 protein n=1 Tax=Symbiodinium natans TaxID=878477 RepID=A0A812GUJ3_9DINO|nr:KCNH7 [Symbiodinium natans]